MSIHPTAIIHPGTELEDEVTVGPYSVIGERVRIGKGTEIGAHVVIEGNTEIGSNCKFFQFSSIGTTPQYIQYKGEDTKLIIGNNNVFREFATVHRATVKGGGKTVIGNNNYFMAYVHIAHDCFIGNNVIMANNATLGGHIVIEDYAVIGGLTGIHQFVKIGAYAMVGACSAVSQDVPPYMIAVGNRSKLYGLNIVGLRRNKFSEEAIKLLKNAYNILFRSKLALHEAIEKVEKEIKDSKEVMHLVEFIKNSKRGIGR